MVARDRTGPRGLGPRTGRGLGDCSPEFTPDMKDKKDDKEFKEDIEFQTIEPQPVTYGLGRGGLPRGGGRGFGRGRGFGFSR